MKNIIIASAIIAGTAAIIVGIGLLVKRRGGDVACECEPDGGVSLHVDSDAPKVIGNTRIRYFSCEGSFVAEDELGNCNCCNYSALIKEDGASYSVYDRFGEGSSFSFDVCDGLMDELYALFSKYELAQYNGVVRRVSGLPEGYGAAVDVSFANGESVYSVDNETCFLPDGFGLELYEVMKKYGAGQKSH